MTAQTSIPSRFRQLHRAGPLLILPNAWDAASARIIEDCGARAIATTSAGLAWAHGYRDGNALPKHLASAAVERIARVIRVPLTIDIEAEYSSDPKAVADFVRAVASAGAVGINIEDGADRPSLLCAKIEAIKTAAESAGVDLFVNARVDDLLRSLVAPERHSTSSSSSATHDIHLSDLADSVALSPYHFLRVFKRETGITPYRFLVQARIRRAVDLLRNTERPITRIAYEVGFGDLSNFIHTFRREIGYSPAQFRKVSPSHWVRSTIGGAGY